LNRVSLRYAAALASVAAAHNNIEPIREGLAAFASLYSGSSLLGNFISTPAVSRAAKRSVVRSLAGELAVVPEVRNFLLVLVDHSRLPLIGEIQEAFGAELNRRLGIQRVSVTSARDLDSGEKEGLGTALERLTGMKIEARYGRDERLIGGAIVQIGSAIYDGSVREQLNRLKARLESEF
jgi:F-type H+-transporting ATPase subunit delta